MRFILKPHRRSIRTKKRRKIYLNKKRKAKIGVATKLPQGERRRVKPYHNPYEDYDFVAKPPSDCRITTNRDRTIEFLNSIEMRRNVNDSVFVELNGVEYIDDETLVMLLAIMAEFHFLKIPINGSFPLRSAPKAKLVNSGFLKRLYPKFERYTFDHGDQIKTHGQHVYDSQRIATILKPLIIQVYGEERFCQGLHSLITEAMKNTITHADPHSERESYWWISASYDRGTSKATVTFLDYGVGIFESLRTIFPDSPGYSVLQKLWELGTSNAEILEKIMLGKTGRVSRTRIQKHGRGLPYMKTCLERGFVESLKVISNDVYADVSGDSYETMPHSFGGTIIQVSFSNNCLSHSVCL